MLSICLCLWNLYAISMVEIIVLLDNNNRWTILLLYDAGMRDFSPGSSF